MDKQQADTLALLLVRDLIKFHHAITIQGDIAIKFLILHHFLLLIKC